MEGAKLKQFAASILVVLSLFVSLVPAACVCAHDSLQGETSEHSQIQPHSHGIKTGSHHSHEEAEAPHHDEAAKTETAVARTALSFSETECCCIQAAPKVFAKPRTVKTEKQAARILPPARIETALTPQIVSIKTIELARPFYLSDSFHNLAPGRAPPRL